jgi:hypothetical protein
MSDIVTELPAAPIGGGTLIVLTAPLTEIIVHAGYVIQMSMASAEERRSFIALRPQFS